MEAFRKNSGQQMNRDAIWLAALRRKKPSVASLILMVLMIGLSGCGSRDSTTEVKPPPQRPLRAMESAIRRGQLAEAWEFADEVLAEHSDDAETIATVAWLAHENGDPKFAAEMLEKACRAEGFAKGPRVLQAMVAMIGVGRLHDGMMMLEEAVAAHPTQHETRRWLYDFYMGSEDRSAGLPHGRYLVRHRQFDVGLLMTLSNTEYRTQDAKPLEEMTARNPDDKRPLLGEAKHKYDERDFAAAITLLQSITAAHADYLPAQALLGRALAGNGDFAALETWSLSQSEGIEAYADYWLALGDWARAKNQHGEAARAYWEATRQDPDVLESWSKLSTALRQLAPSGDSIPAEMLEAIDQRATLLSTFNQLKQKFERTGGISRETAVEIVDVLRRLGRLWEAEAWASMALTLPEDDAVAAEEVRKGIVAMLEEDTPWQTSIDHPELQLDLAYLNLPAISNVAVSPSSSRPGVASTEMAPIELSLLNEATERGLNFFGRTSDTLDQPGIMLYQTLGCGGATIDFDLDGWSDLYLMAAGGTPPKRDSAPNGLMRNLGGFFTDATPASETGDTGFGQGAAVGDVNEDGLPDLLVLNYGPNSLLINNGDGTFTDASESLSNNGDSWSTSGAIADLDGDGISDIVVVNYCAGLGPVTESCPMKDSDVFRSCSPVKFAAEPDDFLQGTDEGRFVDRSEDWEAKPNIMGRGLGIIAGSLDPNPGIDVFVANDMTNNHYWSSNRNASPFKLMESAMLRGLGTDDRALAQGSMGIATGDLDRDGDLDMYVTNFEKEYNTYHEQLDGGIWRDVTSNVGLSEPAMPLVGFGTEAVDLDLDGSLELVVSNGHVDMFSRGDELSVYEHPMQLFRRTTGGQYESVGESLPGEYASSPHVGRALWTIDANRDGLTDLAVTHQTEPTALLINHSKPVGNWFSIKLVGRECSRDAIGAVVEVTAGDQRQKAVLLSGDGYMCSNERLLHFGLGVGTTACDLRITWPDGSEQTHRQLATNRCWVAIQSDSEAHSSTPD